MTAAEHRDRGVAIVTALLAEATAGPQDMSWQHRYRDESELVAELSDQLARLRRGDPSRLSELRIALLPTGALNEIAISSGWSERYRVLADAFDDWYRPDEW